MKSCPTCGRTYDETMRFCLDDGAPLGSAAEPTLRMPAPVTEPPQTIRATEPAIDLPRPVVPRQFAAGSDAGRGRGLLWLAVALIIGASAIAVAIILTRGRQPDTAAVSAPVNSSSSPSQSSSTPARGSTVDPRMGDPAGTPQVNRQMAQAAPQVKATSSPRPTPERTKTDQPTPLSNAATPPASNAPRAPISGGVMNGKAIHLVQPAYPPIARAAHAAGTVTVQVLIDESGNVVSAHAVSGHPLLQASAVNAARSSKFTPTKISGQPVKVSGVITYNFVAQ